MTPKKRSLSLKSSETNKFLKIQKAFAKINFFYYHVFLEMFTNIIYNALISFWKLEYRYVINY